MKKLLLFVLPILFTLCFAAASIHGTAVPTPPTGQVYLMSPASTFWGMIQAVKQAPGSFILSKDNYLIFSWAIEDGGQAYAMLNASIPNQAIPDFLQKAGGNGSFVNIKDMNQLMTCLKENGWKIISAMSVPEVIKVAIVQGYVWMVNLSKTMPTFIFVPGDSFNQLKDQYQLTPILS